MWALLQIYILMLKITCKFFLSVQQRKTLKHTLMYAIYIHKKIIGTWFTVNPINSVDDSFHFLSFIFVLIVSMFCSILLNLENMQINNAVSNAYSYKPLAEASDEDLMCALIVSSPFVFLSLILNSLSFNFPPDLFSYFWSLMEICCLQWSCHYKFPWIDDMLPTDRNFYFLLTVLFGQYVCMILGFLLGNKDDVEPTSRGAYFQHWWSWFRWKTNPKAPY